jgi:hypothetical protein
MEAFTSIHSIQTVLEHHDDYERTQHLPSPHSPMAATFPLFSSARASSWERYWSGVVPAVLSNSPQRVGWQPTVAKKWATNHEGQCYQDFYDCASIILYTCTKVCELCVTILCNDRIVQLNALHMYNAQNTNANREGLFRQIRITLSCTYSIVVIRYVLSFEELI